MPRPLIDPRLFQHLGQFYPSTVTIQANTASTRQASGKPAETWTDVTGLTALPCAVGPAVMSAAERAEHRWPTFTETSRHRLISIAGPYPAITSAMRAVVNGTDTYSILGVELDSHGILTRLYVEIASV